MVSPFQQGRAIVTGVKERFESLLVQGDRLYAGSSTGNLHIYSWDESSEDPHDAAHPIDKKALTRRSIDQLGVIRDINSLVVLSEASVTLFPLPMLSPPTQLPKSKTAFSFAIHSSIQRLLPEGSEQRASTSPNAQPIPTLVTQLLVGCRRKVVLYSWRDGEPQETKECPLPHSARAITFIDKDTVAFAYETEYAIFNIPSMSVTDIAPPTTISNITTTAGGALTGLTGYMTLGLGAKPKPTVLTLGEQEILIPREAEGCVVGKDGRPSEKSSMTWPAPPEELQFLKPYVISVLPAGTVPDPRAPAAAGQSFIPTTVIQVRSSVSAQPWQNISLPFDSSSPPVATSNAQIRLLTSSASASTAKSPSMLLVSTPVDRTTANTEGSTIWHFSMRPWAEQIDDLVRTGCYADALALLEVLETTAMPDKEQRVAKIRALNAVAQFQNGEFDSAIDTFLELDINPAKVVALYPENISGRLAVPQAGWIGLFGGPVDVQVGSKGNATPDVEHHTELAPADLLASISSGSIRKKFGFGIGALMGGTMSREKDDDSASIRSANSRVAKHGPHHDLHRSVDVLIRYLSDRRPKVVAALKAHNIVPSTPHEPLSSVSVESLLGDIIPSHVPLTALTPTQLTIFAQIVYTSLFKCYIFDKPGMLGSWCRIENWCEVGDVEQELRGLKKFNELKDLYHGKGMHEQALALLKEQSESETDTEMKLLPSILYLQKLGPEHLSRVFESSRWLFDVDKDMAFDIFTSEDVELPRHSVADFLEDISPELCVRYLEFLIEERGEIDVDMHDRLVDLYLDLTEEAKHHNNEEEFKTWHDKLLHFLEHTDYYHVDGINGRIYREDPDLFEARAILHAKMGEHDQALELYVYKLADYLKAEEYCKHLYAPQTEPNSQIFLTLLRIYLQPRMQTAQNLLQPALELISRHGRRLDSVKTLELLPPLVAASDIRPFLVEALRTPVFDSHVIKEITKARKDQIARKLMHLESRRVMVTTDRICPNCHKRLGGGVIAVHFPRGEVTHYQCRDPFSKKLKEMRH